MATAGGTMSATWSILRTLLLASLAATISTLSLGSAEAAEAGVVLCNGKIYTADKARSI